MLDLQLTPVEQRMFDLLITGREVLRVDLFKCLDDNLAGASSIDFHLSNLRKKMRRQGYEIISRNGHCQVFRRISD